MTLSEQTFTVLKRGIALMLTRILKPYCQKYWPVAIVDTWLQYNL